MQSIALRTTSVKSPKPHRSWQQRKLASELDSASEISHKLSGLRTVLQQFSADEATTVQSHFLRGQALPLIDSLENCLRRMRIVAEKADEVQP